MPSLWSYPRWLDEANLNLTKPEKELFHWHCCLGHIGFWKVQFLMRMGVLSQSQRNQKLHMAACKIIHPPKCATCQFGKQKQGLSPGKQSSVIKDHDGVLKKDHLLPGQCVSVDHFVCNTKGQLYTSRGKMSPDDMYDGGCIYFNHASGFIHCEHQVHLTTHETLQAKEHFEWMCHDYGVIPQTYLSDNGKPFVSRNYEQCLATFKQIQNFAGVGAHHHNGMAEDAIQTIMSIVWSMMLHATIHWPKVADTSLQPMAVNHAVYLYNHVPNELTGLAPIDIFTHTHWTQSKFHDLHVWGCPVYVLDNTIADGKKLPCWKPCSHHSINMGHSPKHASTVPLVLNPATGAITTAFCVIFDDWFATVPSTMDLLLDFNSAEWNKMFGESTYQYPFDEDDLESMMMLTEPSETANVQQCYEHHCAVEDAMDAAQPFTPLPVMPPPTTLLSQPTPFVDAISTLREPLWREHSPQMFWSQHCLGGSSPNPTLSLPASGLSNQQREMMPMMPMMPGVHASPTSPVAPVPETPLRAHETVVSDPMSITKQMAVSKPMTPTPNPTPVPTPPPRHLRHVLQLAAEMQGMLARTSQPFLHTNHYSCPHLYQENGFFMPLVFKASNLDPDTLTFDEAMADTANHQGWLEATANEISALEAKGTWEEVDILQAESKILPRTWVFHHKHTPDGTVLKLKARYCICGDLQEGEFDTHAQVVSWSSIQVFLVLSIILKWHTCTINFSNAFFQAKLDAPVWIHLPHGSKSEHGYKKTCLCLKKSLYGLLVAPRLWSQHILSALKKEGFASEKCFVSGSE